MGEVKKASSSDRIFDIDFLTEKDNYYLTNKLDLVYSSVPGLELKDIALYRIKEISFEEQAPRKEALENVLSTMKIEGIHFIYLILGDESGVHFYYGVAKDHSCQKDMDLDICDIGKIILESSIKGNFRGSKTAEVDADDKKKIVDRISQMKYFSMLEGVPGYTKEEEKFQGVDRLVDVMLGDTFGFMIIAKPLHYDDIKRIERNLYEIYTRIVPFSKKSVQEGSGESGGASTTRTEGSSFTEGSSYSKTSQENVTITDGTNSGENDNRTTTTTGGTSENTGSSSNSRSKSEGYSESKAEGTSKGKSHSEAKTIGGSESRGSNKSESTNQSKAEQKNEGWSKSNTMTLEHIDKKSQDWIKYLDEIILPRLDYGSGKGIFTTISFLFADNKAALKKLENTSISLYSGKSGNKIPLRAVALEKKEHQKVRQALTRFQLPAGSLREDVFLRENIIRTALSQYIQDDKKFLLGNWITTNELALIAGLPQKDVVGLELREEVEFGLNFTENIEEEDRLELGRLVQSGNVLDNIRVSLDKKNLNKHIFITGVTGSGKTTTCQKILLDSGLPFLVIEPAKTEYRVLSENCDDLLIFTLGSDTVTPFRLNPFEFFPHESITSRVDMIRASIEAAFDMEAAIPQIIETAIYACYVDYGWNIANNRNERYGKAAFDKGVYSFPTLEDLINKIESVVKEQGFDERLKNDYIGSIRARLQGLLMGSKGMMLNTRRSIDFQDLLEKRVVLELEEIRSASEKSLVMGFVLTNLMEAIKGRFLKKGQYGHITLVEEAHRLLSKFTAGDSPNKKHGVETFTDMLAEIRKYGESLIIVDQIPNKLTPEVLKNTNTKIVHKLFAEDDKEAIGNTIVLEKEQREFLSNLDIGRAIVFTQGFNKALQVQIESRTDTTGDQMPDIERIKTKVYEYYAENYERGVLEGSQYFLQKPSSEDIREFLERSKMGGDSGLQLFFLKIFGRFPDKEAEIRKILDEEPLLHLMNSLSSASDQGEEEKEKLRIWLREALEKNGKEMIIFCMAVLYCTKVKKISDYHKILSMNQFDILSRFAEEYLEGTEINIRYYRDELTKSFS